MRFMILIKANADSEAGKLPSDKLLREMTAYNEQLVKAGVLLAAEGLHPSSKGARVRFSPGGKRKVLDGPFAESKEFLAGFWLVDVDRPERAYEIAARASSAPGPGGVPLAMPIEVRQVLRAPLPDA